MTPSRAGGALDRILTLAGARGGRGGGRWEPRDGRSSWIALRPSLPPLLFLALALWASAAACLDGLFGRPPETCAAALLAGSTATAAALGLLRFGRVAAGSLLLGAALGCLIASSQALSLMEQRDAVLAAPGMQEVEMAGDARAGDHGSTATARTAAGGLVRLRFQEDVNLMAGQVVRFDAAWREPSGKSARQCWRDGVVAVADARSFEVLGTAGPLAGLRDARRAAIGEIEEARALAEGWLGVSLGEAALFLRAVLLGFSDGLYGSAFYQDVKACGLAHLVAVSGAHLVIACSLAAACSSRLPFGRGVGVVLQVAVIAGYLVLTGAPVSAIRAAIMSSLSLLSFFAGRRPYALGGLSACLVLMLAIDPSAAFSTSLLLSASATLGIVLFATFFEEWLAGALRLPRGLAVEALGLTLASSVITLPLSASAFGQVSLVSPLANLLVSPLVVAMMTGGLAATAASLAVPAAGGLLLAALMVPVQAFCLLLGSLAALPLASLPVALEGSLGTALAVLLPAALWVAWPRPGVGSLGAGAALLAAGALAVAIAPALHGDELVMLDVGQGDAFLVRSGGHAMLVDTGTQDTALLEGLGACGVRKLDAVLVTHPDDDHCGSLPALRGVVDVGRVLVADDLLDEAGPRCAALREAAARVAGPESLVGLSVGDAVACGGIRLTVLGPDSFVDGGGNADSLTLLMESDDDGDGSVDHTALLCGDAEAAQLHAYARKGRLRHVEIYKVGHHGSRAAIDGELAGLLDPEVSLVSVGEGNRYGHPVESTLETLAEAGSTVFRTDERGRVTCLLEPDRLEVRCER